MTRLFATIASRGVHGPWPEKTIMPTHLKALVHARMEKTGESWQQALRHVRAQVEHASHASQASHTTHDGEAAPKAERLERSRTLADTAFSIAAVRAEEADRHEDERLFVDPYAALFASAGVHVAEATQRFLELPFFRDGVRLRTRYIDDAVRAGLAAGLDQVVILGAGFDARGMRMPEMASRGAQVYEVDTHEQLSRKRKMLTAAGHSLPGRIDYVSFDFEIGDLEATLLPALEAKGFRKHAGAIFVWEGVIGYIDRSAIDRSLRFMASAGGSRSRVVFTYGDGSFAPDSAAEAIRKLGFASCEELAGDELWRKYLAGDAHPNAFVMKVGTAMV